MRRIVRLLLVVALMGLLTGCATTSSLSEKVVREVAPTVEEFVLRLPRIYVQYVKNGAGAWEPSIWGIKASDIEYWTGADLGMLKIPDFYMDWLKDSNVQHIEVVQNGDGIFIFVNGQPLPHLAWSGESISYAAEVAEAFQVPNAPLLRTLLPLLRHIGLDVVVQMPLQEGAEPIPYRDAKQELTGVKAQSAVEEPSVQLHLEITYDEEGVPYIWGMSAELLGAMGYGVPGKLPPETVAALKEAGIQRIALQTKGDGLFLFINDRPLPHIAWSEDHLSNAVNLYAVMNATSWVPNEAFVSAVQELVLQLGNSDILLVVNFPQ